MAYHHPRYERDLQNRSLLGHPEDANLATRIMSYKPEPQWGLVHLNLGLFLNSPRSWVLTPFYKHIPFHTIFGGMKRFSGELYPKQNIKSWKGHNNTKPRLGEGCLIMSIWHTHEITKIIDLIKSQIRYNHTFLNYQSLVILDYY